MSEAEAELADLKIACRRLLDNCVIRTKSEITTGPYHYIDRIERLIRGEDRGHALAVVTRLREALLKVASSQTLQEARDAAWAAIQGKR